MRIGGQTGGRAKKTARPKFPPSLTLKVPSAAEGGSGLAERVKAVPTERWGHPSDALNPQRAQLHAPPPRTATIQASGRLYVLQLPSVRTGCLVPTSHCRTSRTVAPKQCHPPQVRRPEQARRRRARFRHAPGRAVLQHLGFSAACRSCARWRLLVPAYFLHALVSNVFSRSWQRVLGWPFLDRLGIAVCNS